MGTMQVVSDPKEQESSSLVISFDAYFRIDPDQSFTQGSPRVHPDIYECTPRHTQYLTDGDIFPSPNSSMVIFSVALSGLHAFHTTNFSSLSSAAFTRGSSFKTKTQRNRQALRIGIIDGVRMH